MNKPRVTIGIPAYNEEKNICYLLTSILRQHQTNYVLAQVLVVCDGCTDKTVEVVTAFAHTNPIITIRARAKRQGKAVALNEIYTSHSGDYLLTIDADLVFKGTDDIATMVDVMEKNPHVNIVGPRHIPIWPHSLWGRFAYNSYRSFEDAFLRWNNGNNFYAVMSANLIRGRFSKSFLFPKGTISDQCYLWAKATQSNAYGFRFVKNSEVLFRPVSTFRDWRILGVRSTAGDKEDLAKHFGRGILSRTVIPKLLACTSLLFWLIQSPLYTTGSIYMNIFVRVFPYRKMRPKNGMWQTTLSSKKAIIKYI